MNQILVSLSGHSESSIYTQAAAVQRSLQSESVQMSALYRKLTVETNQIDSPIMSVVSYLSKMSLAEVRAAFEQINSSDQGPSAIVLSYNQIVDLNPEFPVPHPNLQTDILVLHCAAEIQAQFEHPILGRSLQELVNSSYSRHGHIQFEFISRGASLT